MKIQTNRLFMVVVFCIAVLFYACKGRKDTPKTITETFNADFTGNYTYVGIDTLPHQKCTDTLSAWRAIVDGSGTGSHLGSFVVHFDFCGKAEGRYRNMQAFMVTENSDTLFVSCEGQVYEGRLGDHPVYVTSYWRDPFQILGGTGIFKGATGSGITDDYNSSEDKYSHHHWTGTITLRKGNE
ncbi:MAG: hypothetical protein JXB00_19210 [Bacteroidales bacterium]|nr:hypothetical protein [Bacteroidales bacterium]